MGTESTSNNDPPELSTLGVGQHPTRHIQRRRHIVLPGDPGMVIPAISRPNLCLRLDPTLWPHIHVGIGTSTSTAEPGHGVRWGVHSLPTRPTAR